MNCTKRFNNRTLLPAFFVFTILLSFTSCIRTGDYKENDSYKYTNKTLDISNETDNARANFWRSDGLEIFVTGRNTENVVSYTLDEAWEISTAKFSNEFDLSNELGSTDQNSVVNGLYLRYDGEKMWVFNRTEMWGYTLASPWDISTAEKTYYVDFQDFVQRGHDFDFRPDGTQLFIDDRRARAVFQLDLSTPWDITTATLSYTLDISDHERAVRGIEFIEDGKTMMLMDTRRREVLRYKLTEAYDIQTAVFYDAFDVRSETSNPRGISFHPDASIMYITGTDNGEIYQYEIIEDSE